MSTLVVAHAACGVDEFGHAVVGLFQTATEDPEGSWMVIASTADETYSVVFDGGPCCEGGLSALRRSGPRQYALLLDETAARLLGLPHELSLQFVCPEDAEAEAVRLLGQIIAMDKVTKGL